MRLKEHSKPSKRTQQILKKAWKVFEKGPDLVTNALKRERTLSLKRERTEKVFEKGPDLVTNAFVTRCI